MKENKKKHNFYYIECSGSRAKDAAEILRRNGGEGDAFVSLDEKKLFYIDTEGVIASCDIGSRVGLMVKQFYNRLELKEKVKITKKEIAEIIGMDITEFDVIND